MSKAPKFEVGDIVEYELQVGEIYPRWHLIVDRGGGGDTFVAQVTRIGRCEVFTATPRSPSSGVAWDWPLEGHIFYSEDQWDRPGYLRHAEGVDSSLTGAACDETKHKCHCKWEIVLSYGCQCGGV